MPALDFPASPTNGQVYGQYTYDATKGAWRVTGLVGTSVVSSATPPASPVAGMLWFNTNDGVLFTYFNDGDTSQWVEVKSNTASGSTVAARVDALEAKPSGLVPVIPTSVSVASGTATVNSTGAVTFNTSTGLALDGVFTSAYRNYRIVFSTSSGDSQDGTIYFKFRNAGGNVSGTNYKWAALYANNNNTSPFVAKDGGADSVIWMGQVYGNTNFVIDVYNPQLSGTPSSMTYQSQSDVSAILRTITGSGKYALNGTTDGFRVDTTIGNLSSGQIQVYGYR